MVLVLSPFRQDISSPIVINAHPRSEPYCSNLATRLSSLRSNIASITLRRTGKSIVTFISECHHHYDKPHYGERNKERDSNADDRDTSVSIRTDAARHTRSMPKAPRNI